MKFINCANKRRKFFCALIVVPLGVVTYAFSKDNPSSNQELEINQYVDNNFEMKEKAVSKIKNETGANVLNVTDHKNKDGKSTIKFKVIKDGKVKIIEQNSQ